MALADFFRRPRGNATSPVSRRRRRKAEPGTAILHFLENSRLVAAGVFVLTVASIFTISFVGVSPAAFRILPDQEATVRLTADSDFSYESALLTARKRERLLKEVPPVFRVNLAPADQFSGEIRHLLSEMGQLDERWSSLPETGRLTELTRIADAANARSGFQVSVRDLLTLMNYADGPARERLVENGLFVVREILRGGVYNPDNTPAPSGERELMMTHVERESGQMSQTRVLSLDDAMTSLKVNLAAENVPQTVTTALVRLLRPGMRANLTYDEKLTASLQQQMLASLKPEVVHVGAGQSIIERGMRVTREQHEMLREYQKFLNRSSRLPSGIDEQMLGRVLLVLGMIIVAGFILRLEDPMTLQSNSRLGLLALVLVFSLSLLRMTLELGNEPLLAASPEIEALLPYVAPAAFAPMILAVLMGAGPALYCGLLVSVFAAIIFGNRLDVLVLSLLAASVAAFACRAVRRRSRLVRAGWLSGLTVAVFAPLLCLADHAPPMLALKVFVGAQATGFLTGVVVAVMLPLLEGLFRRTTDITLLELTDYNHPLLRRMQMDAPGTYHHSLMVANLSENAANAISANALLCRVCSMFHDIGKLVKPEYFSENQRGGVNPHAERTPSFSALIIKSHVKEGVDLAIKHKLPRPVIDVIRQHHGTTLIRYFYERARQRARSAAEACATAGATPDPQAAEESTYRYDGPRPRFRESAIILMADSVEAASRSLQKVTPQAVDELIESIVREKIDDRQIDDAPLTIQEIAQIKRSFTFTLLNSLHSRVVYPKAEQRPPRTDRNEEPAPVAPTAALRAGAPAAHGARP